MYGESAEIDAAIEKLSDQPCRDCKLAVKVKLAAPVNVQPVVAAHAAVEEDPVETVEPAAPASAEPKEPK